MVLSGSKLMQNSVYLSTRPGAQRELLVGEEGTWNLVGV